MEGRKGAKERKNKMNEIDKVGAFRQQKSHADGSQGKIVLFRSTEFT